MYEDRTLVCQDCGKEFIFTAREQEFYAEKGFTNEPKRCFDCRKARKNNKERHTIICADCGKEDTIPFKPYEGKDYYCKECHEKRKAAETVAPTEAAAIELSDEDPA